MDSLSLQSPRSPNRFVAAFCKKKIPFKQMYRTYFVETSACDQFFTHFYQLPGVEACERYSFRYGRNPLVELPLLFNAAGSARVQPRTNSTFSSLVIRYLWLELKSFVVTGSRSNFTIFKKDIKKFDFTLLFS